MVQVDPNAHPTVVRVPETIIESPLLLLSTSKCMKGLAVTQLVFGILTLGVGIGASVAIPFVWVNLTGVIGGGVWLICGIIGTMSTRGVLRGKCPINGFYGLFSLLSVLLGAVCFVLGIYGVLVYLILGQIACEQTGDAKCEQEKWIATGLFAPIVVISVLELLIGSVAFLQTMGLRCCCMLPCLRPKTMFVEKKAGMDLDEKA